MSTDVVCKGCIGLEASVICVTMHELRFWLSVKGDEMKAANMTVKIYQRNSMTKAVGPKMLLKGF